MDGVKSKENETGMGERGAAREGSGKGKAAGEKGTASWADIVHSFGLPDKPVKEGLLTKEGQPDVEEI